MTKNRKIAVIGLGYVGLPVALAFACKFPGVVGYDISESRVKELLQGQDRTAEVLTKELQESSITFSSKEADLEGCDFFIVTVPTPVDSNNRPDLSALVAASNLIGRVMRPGAIAVYESTVYPGVTQEVCGPAIAESSGLKQGIDFKLGYSPERINPGDKEHSLAKVIKVVSGEDEETLEEIAYHYGAIVEVGLHKVSSIQVAEAAKVIENTQRDLNIALMNELAIIFDKLGISSKDVLDAAGTKWNFLRFSPGLVGGHCIGVDPYYLTSKAEQLGYHPEVILAGRRINDGMGSYIAQRTIKLMINAGLAIKDSRIGILGIAFKENVPDTRNSRVPDIVRELEDYGVHPIVHDPLVSAKSAQEEYGLYLSEFDDFKDLDACILAVAHRFYVERIDCLTKKILQKRGVFVDIKSVVPRSALGPEVTYWSL